MKNANDNTWKGGFNADTHKEEKTEQRLSYEKLH